MKTLNALICFALLTFVSSQAAIIEVAPANARMSTMICGGGVPAAGAESCTACVTETYMLCYNGDYTSDTDKACFTNGDANGDGTNSSITISAAYVEYDNANSYIYWDNTAERGFDDAVGTLFITLYVIDLNVDETMGVAVFLEIHDSVGMADSVKIMVNAGPIRAYFYDNGDPEYLETGNVSFLTSYRIGYTWNIATGFHCLSVMAEGNDPSWSCEDDSIAAFADTATQITLGENISGSSVAEQIRLSDFLILDGYQTDDPAQ